MLLCILAIAFSKYLDSSSGCWRENAFNCRHDQSEVSGQRKLQQINCVNKADSTCCDAIVQSQLLVLSLHWRSLAEHVQFHLIYG